jgi:uridine kinase
LSHGGSPEQVHQRRKQPGHHPDVRSVPRKIHCPDRRRNRRRWPEGETGADCRTFLFRQDHIFPAAFCSDAGERTAAHSHLSDNYFKEREQTPRLPDGSYDFESIEALDTELFNEHMEQLIDGKTVDIPHFNFKSGHREYRGQQAYLGDDGVLVVEGIHGMNEKLSARVRRRNKLKIYISALTPLSFDDYNRIPTTDMRLLRRMVRDSQFRSHNARQTIENWPKVRQGEERNIFPFSEEADIMFNTTLIYELAVFKKYACPLLEQIPQRGTGISGCPELSGYAPDRRTHRR